MTNPLSAASAYLRAHPILCLLLLSPGIPEYISSSSPLNALILNPAQFALQIVANLGLYGPGVLLIREASIRWKKGWATILILGAAYGILEEGIALSTLFNPLAGPVGKLGFYGHYLGVNWVWLAGILPVHMIYSISLPILLLGLALPETRGKSLVVSRKGITSLLVILGADVTALFLFVLRGEHFWMGWPIFVGSFIAIAFLILIARRVPTDLLRAKNEAPDLSPLKIGIVGALFYTSVLLVEFVGMGTGVPTLADVFLVLTVQFLFLVLIRRVIGRENNSGQLIALAAGLIAPIATIGFVAEIRLPMILLVDCAFGIFFWKIWKKQVDITLVQAA
ncbi:MAG: hypothetical protein JRN52_10315 [Nitrososphaerota archaeon]|nr:hypothetical protein [Nitrososphaerota archaeon]